MKDFNESMTNNDVQRRQYPEISYPLWESNAIIEPTTFISNLYHTLTNTRSNHQQSSTHMLASVPTNNPNLSKYTVDSALALLVGRDLSNSQVSVFPDIFIWSN